MENKNIFFNKRDVLNTVFRNRDNMIILCLFSMSCPLWIAN